MLGHAQTKGSQRRLSICSRFKYCVWILLQCRIGSSLLGESSFQRGPPPGEGTTTGNTVPVYDTVCRLRVIIALMFDVSWFGLAEHLMVRHKGGGQTNNDGLTRGSGCGHHAFQWRPSSLSFASNLLHGLMRLFSFLHHSYSSVFPRKPPFYCYRISAC